MKLRSSTSSLKKSLTLTSKTASKSDASDCYAEDGAPLKCEKCGCTSFVEKVMSVVAVLDNGDGPTTEAAYHCLNCKTQVGYWAYGSWDPA